MTHLPLFKPWRSFPELDQYTDEKCRALLKAAKPGLARQIFQQIVGLLIMSSVVPIILLGPILAVALGVDYAGFLLFVHVVACALMAIALATAVKLMASHQRRIQLQRMIEGNLCVECGYSLLGVPVVDELVACPECGWSGPSDSATRLDSGR